MLDRREIPLVIDQPENNLDNKKCLRNSGDLFEEGKKTKTDHYGTLNPNLTVVADAEQIVHVSIDNAKIFQSVASPPEYSAAT